MNRLTQGIIAEPGDVGPRLSRVAATVCGTSNGAAWWVSAIDGDHILDRYCGTPRDEETRDGEWQPTQLSPQGYRLSNFPATAEAVGGGSFVADARTEMASAASWSRPASGSSLRRRCRPFRRRVAGQVFGNS